MNAAGLSTTAAPVSAASCSQPDQLALVVGLADVDLEPELGGGLAAGRGQVVERGGAVDLRLAGPEAPEVGPVEDEDAMRAGRSVTV